MKALVTGATGFVGSHLAEALRRRGDEVTALARSPSKAAALAPLGVRVVPGDLARPGRARSARSRARTSSITWPAWWRPGARPSSCAANRDGTAQRGRGGRARRRSARFVLVSSHGGRRARRLEGRPLTGDEPPRPVTAYGRSKLAAEAGGDRRAGCPGPSSGRRWSTARATRRCSRCSGWPGSASRPVFGDGTQELSAVHGADLADALIAAGDRATATVRPDLLRLPPRGLHRRRAGAGRRPGDGQVAGGDPGARHDRPRRAHASPRPPRGSPARPPSSPPTRPTSSSSRPGPATPTPLTRDTGWRAAHDLRTGLARDLQWYRTAGWL